MEPQPTLDLHALLEHAGWARSLAAQLVRDAAAADDLAQDTWLAAIERPPAPDRPIRRWLAAVMRNLARESHRRHLRRAARERTAAADEAVDSTAELAARLDSHRHLVAAVAALDEPYRATVMLRWFEGRAPRAIARIQGVPVATVHTRLQRAHARLRTALDDSHGGKRGAWLAAFAPFAPLPLAPISLAHGLILMNAKLVAAGVAAVLVLAVVALAVREAAREATADARPAAAPAAGSRAPEVAAANPAPAGERIAATAPPGPTASAPAAPAARGNGERFRGRVVDLRGQPVANVKVRIRPGLAVVNPSADDTEVVSDERGEFESSSDWSGHVTVASERWLTVLAGTVPRSPERRTVVVVAERMALGGIVSDEAGAPVALAELELQLPADLRARLREILDDSVDESWQTWTDATGGFRFEELPAVDGATLRTMRTGYEPHVAPSPTATTWTHAITLRRARAPGGAITGTVLDAEGQPAVAALVSWGHEAATTDDAGRFHLVARAGTRVTVTAVKTGSLPATAVVDLPAAGPGPEPLVLRLGGAPLSITGRVLDAANQPVRPATVWAEPTWFGLRRGDLLPTESLVATGGWSAQVATDEQGGFELHGLLARDYTVWALDPKTLQVVRRESIAAGSRGADLVFPKGDLVERIAGRVVDRRGAPVAGARVGTQREAWCLRCPEVSGMSGCLSTGAPGPSTQTDADGRFELRRVARDGVSLDVDDPSIVPVAILVAERGDLDRLVLTVSRRCHFKVELRDPAEADGFALLDGSGQVLQLTVRKGNVSSGETQAKLEAGRSAMATAEETARTIVLYRGTNEVRRAPIELRAGEPTILQP